MNNELKEKYGQMSFEDDNVYSIEGWHGNDDDTWKVDKCVRINGNWHYHAVEDSTKNPVDFWVTDNDLYHCEAPDLFDTKEKAYDGYEILSDKRDHKWCAMSDRIAAETAEQMKPFKAFDKDYVRVCFEVILDKLGMDEDYVIINQRQNERYEMLDSVVKILEDGGVYDYSRKAFIPLHSISHVYSDGLSTVVVSDDGEKHICSSTKVGEALHKVMKLYKR